MRKQVFFGVLTMVAALAMPAAAQDRRWGGDYRRDMTYGNGGRTAYGNPVTGAMRDLENIFRRARVDQHEAGHFRRALRELDEFDQRARRGQFDRGSLDSAIDNMRDLARADQLHPRDRQVIGRRVQELRSLREGGARY